MDDPRVSFVETRADAGSGRWRLEQLTHPELPQGAALWLAVTDERELLTCVGLRGRASVEAHARRCGAQLSEPKPPSSPAAAQLREYLDGHRTHFDLQVLALGTAFEREAWAALTRIPWGQTRSYAEQARMLGKPGAARAVGRANGRNPVPIVVPCHRVIGSDGTLTGFAGGLALKRWLLAHEGVHLGRDAGPRLVPDTQLGLF